MDQSVKPSLVNMSSKILICLLFVFGVRSERIPLSCQQIKEIVDGHNLHRQDAALGHIPRQPAAADMHAIIWDVELAEKAAEWAENGLFGHNPDRTMVWAESTRIGCGLSQKRENDYVTTLYVCDYGPCGNFIGQTPYKAGSSRGRLQCREEGCKNMYGPNC